ncbi:MAG: GTP cyclohydrolase II [Bacteroidota bacterium]
MNRTVEIALPTKWGAFRMIAYSDTEDDPMPHLALMSENFDPSTTNLLRIHSECMTGDVFGSKRCDCGEQLDMAMQMVSREGGLVIYLRQEGRGIGLINKLKAYHLQEQGLNTADANTHLGLEIDARQYGIAVHILQDLGVKRIKLITNNPDKIRALEESPIQVVGRVPVVIPPHKDNQAYLDTKKDLMGHLLYSNGEKQSDS